MDSTLSDAPVPEARSAWRSAVVAGADLFAWAIFLVGCLSPLTPSEGPPSLGTIAVFVGLPVGLLATVLVRARTATVRVLVAIQLVGLLLLASWVLNISMR